jgi:5-methylcytosine-specific restriction endonuclease McrA
LAQTIKAVRATVWRRDGGRCRVCWRRRGDHVHHLQYRSQGGRWSTANCLLLCRWCHQDVHARILVITGSNADDPAGLVFARHRWW